MAVRALDAVVMHSARLGAMVAFYRAIGVPLEEEQHDGGPMHYACEIGPVHFAISGAPGFRSPGRRQSGTTQVGFQVSDLEAVVAVLREGGAEILQEPEEVPWGHRAVVADPDGRPVELNQEAEAS